MISLTPANFDWESTDKELCEFANQYAKDQIKRKIRIGGFKPTTDALTKRCGRVQLIDQSEWTTSKDFSAPTLPNLCHPHHRILWHRILANYKPKSDVLLVANCSATKPYSNNLQYKFYLKLAKKGWFDLCIMSFHPVPLYPLDASSMYPNNIYNWHHEESEQMVHHEEELNFNQWVEFLSRFHYKKVVFALNQYAPNVRVYNKLKTVFKDIEFFNAYEDSPELREFISEHFQGGNGPWRQRLHSFKCTREFIWQCMGNPPQFRVDARLE